MRETSFKTYQEAYIAACEWAKEINKDIGLENLKSPLGPNWHIWRLPGEKYRFGHEFRCQVVPPI